MGTDFFLPEICKIKLLNVNGEVATVLGSISAFSDTVKSVGRRTDEAVLNKVLKNKKNSCAREFIDSVFAKTSPKRSFLHSEYERFGLVFAKLGLKIRANAGIHKV